MKKRSEETQTLRASCNKAEPKNSPGADPRGVRVYPYPRVYPTRPVPAGTGRVRVDFSRVGSGTGTTSTGTGIPGFTRKEHDFGARTF